MALVSKPFADIITFTRASTATYFDATGTLQSAAINAPRFDYDPATLAARGFLIEEARTNIAIWSASFRTRTLTVAITSGTFTDGETVTATGGGTGTYIAADSTPTSFAIFNGSGTFTGTLTGGTSGATATISASAAAWASVNSSITANAVTAPDGTTTADKLIEALDVNVVHQIGQSAIAVVSLGTYTASTFVKADTRTKVRIVFLVAAGGGVIADADLTAGTIGAASGFSGGTAVGSSIQSVGNGWYRISVSGSGTVGTSGEIRIELLNASGNRQYNGDGTSGLYIWGAQLEAGAFPTSYIPTTTTALTRSADVASVNTLSPWFNSASGTLYAEFSTFSNTTNGYPFAFDDGTASNFISIRSLQSGGNANRSINITSGGVGQASNQFSILPLNTFTKGSLAYKTNDIAATYDGGAVFTDVTATIPSVSTMRIGNLANAIFACIHIKRLTYYPRNLSSAELQAITA